MEPAGQESTLDNSDTVSVLRFPKKKSKAALPKNNHQTPTIPESYPMPSNNPHGSASAEDFNPMSIPLVGFIAVLLLLLIIIVGLKIWKEVTKKRHNSVLHTDENDTYGTYSRGWDGEGEYGDGDVVETIDRNDYYFVYE